MLSRIKENLNPDGILLYHTFPTEYEHIFYRNVYFGHLTSKLSLPLVPFKKIKDQSFTRLVNYYSILLDLPIRITRGKTHNELIRSTVHPNPLSRKRLNEFFYELGFHSIFSREGIEDFNPLKPDQGKLATRHFSDKTVVQRSLWGVAKIS